MKKILEFFKNRIVISVIGLLALSIIIWFVGPAVKFGENNTAPLGGVVARLVTILVLVILWGANNLRIQMQNRKQNDELVEDLQSNNDSLAAGMNDQSTEEIQQLNERFKTALATLKKLKFSGRGSKKALYELPWYIIIGPPGCGKTTALINSTLDFPLADQFGKGALQGVGGTRNCDWWFTNDAVLIDTAGRYTTQDSHRVVDSSAWEGFLNLLKKNRRRRPINGAIVAISVQDLLIQTEDERAAHAKLIRTRIDELMNKLEIRFPIYLMFTKCDLISGFSEFFEDLSKEDREQVWGVSLPNAPRADQGPDFDFLSMEYTNLIQRIYDRLVWRIHQERDVRRRAAIQGFPQQLENMRHIVEQFVKQAFVKNRYQYQPYLRGVYFTSGTQEGTPIDRMMAAVSSGFGFSREAIQLPPGQGKSFFLGRLFREVMFPESELVGANRKYETFLRWAQRGAYVGLVAFLVLVIVVWAGSVTRNDMYMSEVGSYVNEFNQARARLTPWNKDLRATLPALNPLAKASIVYDQEAHPWLSGMGLYDPNVDNGADDAYATQLRELFLPRVIAYLESYLRKGQQGGDLYNTFRTYLMFNKTEHMNKQMVLDWFDNNWAETMHGEASHRKELRKHLEALLNLDLQPVQLNQSLVSHTRNLLLQMPVALRIYSRIKNNPKYNQKVDLLNMFGESVRNAFIIDPDVSRAMALPYMFTKEGYDNIDLSTKSPLIADLVNERWVFEDARNAKVDFIPEDLDEISKKVKDAYLSDYLNAWREVYRHLKIKPFTSLKQANDTLASFVDPVYSPLLSILQVGAQNTTLSSQTMQNLADDHSEGKTGQVTQFLANKFQGTKVDKQFRELNVLLRESSKNPAPVNAIVQKLQQMQQYVNDISLAPEPDKKSFDIAKARYQSGAGNPMTTVMAYSKNTPDPVNRWINTLAEQTWKVVLQSAHRYVNSEWRNQVYQPYQQALAGRYPINRRARDELSLFDFSEFFKPGGTMDKFNETFVKPFVAGRNGTRNRVVDKFSMGFSNATLAQIHRALFIKTVFFRLNPDSPGLSFQLRPYRLDKIDARFALEIGDDKVTYNHGPKFWKSVKWKPDDDNRRVRVIFEDLNGNINSVSYDGPWALFKLQDRSRLQKTRKSNVYLATYAIREQREYDGKKDVIDHKAIFEIKARSVNNPFGSNLLGSFRCPENL